MTFMNTIEGTRSYYRRINYYLTKLAIRYRYDVKMISIELMYSKTKKTTTTNKI